MLTAWRLLLIYLTTGLATACWAAQDGVGSGRIDTLIEDLEQLRKQEGVAAFGLTLVDRQQVLWSGSRGVADLDTAAVPDENTVYRIGSITKAFTALALLIAEQDGDLKLTDPLKDLLEELPYTNPWQRTDPVSLAHLLEHTSGLTDLSWEEMRHSDPTPISLEDALAFRPENRKIAWQPGVHSSYSNAGAGIAAFALQQQTGVRYEDYVESRIFKPLGMHSSSVLLTESVQEHLATGYDQDGVSVLPYWHMLFRPFGAINVTLADMAGFIQLQLNDGLHNGKRILSAERIRRMEVPTTTLAARAGLTHGYGLGNYAWYKNGLLFHGHGGDADGYLSHYGYNRDTGLGYYLVITRFQGSALRKLRNRVEDFISADHSGAAFTKMQPDLDAMRRATGTYVAATMRFVPAQGLAAARREQTVQVVLEHDKLYTLTRRGSKRELVPVSPGLYRRRHEPQATIAIVPDANGQMVLQGSIGNFEKLK